MKVEKFVCDISDCKNEANHQGVKVSMVFTTEQTEGRSVKPYLTHMVLDMCDDCFQFMISKRRLITASGAMGHNEYNLNRE